MRISQKIDLQTGCFTGVSGAGEVKIEGVCAKSQHRNADCPTEEDTYEATEPPDFKSGGFPVADTHNHRLFRPKCKCIVF
jgi:hypothetical protein